MNKPLLTLASGFANPRVTFSPLRGPNRSFYAEKENQIGERGPTRRSYVIGSPRALNGVGYKTPKQLTRATEGELLKLHGFGPNALTKVFDTLQGFSLAKPACPDDPPQFTFHVSRFVWGT